MHIRSRFLRGAVALIALLASALASDAATTIKQIAYKGHDAYRMTDGRTEVVIVPDFGRVMRYGFVGGPNVLWNATMPDPTKPIDYSKWINWGGDKTLIGPQSSWLLVQNIANWPPDAILTSQHKAEMLPGGVLRVTGPVSADWGAHIVREYRYQMDGTFEVNQIFEKASGPRVEITIWDIFQAQAPDAIFLPLNINSPYKTGYQWLIAPNKKTVIPTAGPSMTRISHSYHVSYKIGMDSPVAAIVSVKDGQALVLHAGLPKGDYPDGALNSGFPVELYNEGDPKTPFDELELLGPLKVLGPGDKTSYRITWSLHKLPTRDAHSPVVARMAHKWLYGK